MRWRILFGGIFTSVLLGLVLGFYLAAVFPSMTVGMVFGPVFAIGLGVSVITALQIWAHVVSAVKKWGPKICLVVAFIWVRHLIGSLIDAPLFVKATNYSSHTQYYLVYFVDGYQTTRVFFLDMALVLAGVVALSGIAAGSTWYKKIIYWTMVLNLLLTVFWLAFPGYWNQGQGKIGQPTTQTGRLTKQAFEQAFKNQLAQKEEALEALLGKTKPVAPGSLAPSLTADHWEKVAAKKKEMETMQEDHLKEGKRLFPELYEEPKKEGGNGNKWVICFDTGCWNAQGTATVGGDVNLSIATGGYTRQYEWTASGSPRQWIFVGDPRIGKLEVTWKDKALIGKAQIGKAAAHNIRIEPMRKD